MGIEAAVHAMPPVEGAILSLIGKLGGDDAVDGIILVRPSPNDADPRRVAHAIPPAKDAEGMSPANYGATFLTKTYAEAASGILPCTAFAAIELLRSAEVPVAGRTAVVVGRSNILGKPVAHLLNILDATVALAHSDPGPEPTWPRPTSWWPASAGRASSAAPGWAGRGRPDAGSTPWTDASADGLRIRVQDRLRHHPGAGRRARSPPRSCSTWSGWPSAGWRLTANPEGASCSSRRRGRLGSLLSAATGPTVKPVGRGYSALREDFTFQEPG